MHSLKGLVISLAVLLLLFSSPVLTKPIASLRQADLLVTQKEYARAIDLYNNTLLGSIRPSILHTKIGNVYLEKRRFADAETHFQQALSLDPTDADALIGVGLIELEHNEYKKAADAFQRAEAIRPSERRIAFELGVSYLRSFDFDQAKNAFNTAIGISGGDRRWEAEMQYYLGLSYLARDTNIALSYFQKAQENSDMQGLARLMQNALEESGAVRDDQAYAAARLAHALLQADEKSLAKYYLEKAIGLRPNYAEAKAYLGYIYSWEDRQEEALETLRDAVQLEPSAPIGHYFLGVAFRAQKRLPESVDQFREAIRLDDRNAEAYVELGHTLALQAKYAEAGDMFEKAMGLRPDDVELKLIASWFHLDHLFRVDRGLEIAGEAARIAPDNAEVRHAVGWGLYVNNQVGEAEESLRKAIGTTPFSAKAHYHLAIVLEQKGDIKGAEAEYQRAVDLDTDGSIEKRVERD